MIKRYCQISIKYTLYCFQNLLTPSKKSIFLVLFSLINFTVCAQNSDTLSLKFKKSKLLIINNNNDIDEWSFEDIDQDLNDKEKNREVNFTFGIGWLNLNGQNILKGKRNFNFIPYNTINSNTQNLTFYFKNLKIFRDFISLFIGVGFDIHRLNLGLNETEINKDTLSFKFEKNFKNNRNVLKSNYLIVPLGFSFKIKDRIFAQLELKNHILSTVKLDIKTKNGNEKIRSLTKGVFFQKRHYFSVRGKIIWKSIGIFAESSLISNSNIFSNQFNFSFGLMLCKYR